MIFYLMRRNLPEPLALFFAAFAALTMYVAPRVAPVAGLAFFVMLWAASPQRGSTFEATLPIRGRDICAARLLWHFTLMALPLAAWMYASIAAVTPVIPLNRVIDAPLVVLLALMLPYSLRQKELYDPPFLLVAALWIGLAVVVGATLWLLPADVMFEALLIAVVVVGHSIWVRIPDALEMAPRKVRAAKATVEPNRELEPQRTAAGRAWRPYLYSFFEPGATSGFFLLLVYVFAFVFGAFGEGMIRSWMLLYLYIPVAGVRRETRWLAAFPISNRARLWSVLAPAVLLTLGLFAIGRAASPLFDRDRDPMTIDAPREAGTYRSTRVPLEFWRGESSKSAHVLSAPWGETAAEDSLSLFGHMVYNPFTTSTSNTPRFAEWQFQRATSALFGVEISSNDYERLEKLGMLPGDIFSSLRMKVLNGAVAITVILLMGFISEYEHSCRNILRSRRLKVFGWVVSVGVLTVIFAGTFFVTRGLPDVVMPLSEELLYRVSGALPQNLLLVVLIAAIPVVAAYALLERQFGQSEIVERAEPRSRVSRFLSRPVPYFHTS